MIQLMGIALISAVLCVVIKKYSPEYMIFAELGSVLLVFLLLYPYIKDIIDFYYEYADYGGIDDSYLKLVLKSIGIALLTQFASDICRDSGQSALAGKIEFAGKLFIAVLALPVAKSLIEVALKVTEMG